MRKWVTANRLVVFLLLLVLIACGGNWLSNRDQIQRSNAQQRMEQRRFEQGQAHDAALAKQAQLKAAIPTCLALRKLSRIKGSHGTSNATFGINLEAGLQQVYASSGCPKVLALTGNG